MCRLCCATASRRRPIAAQMGSWPSFSERASAVRVRASDAHVCLLWRASGDLGWRWRRLLYAGDGVTREQRDRRTAGKFRPRIHCTSGHLLSILHRQARVRSTGTTVLAVTSIAMWRGLGTCCRKTAAEHKSLGFVGAPSTLENCCAISQAILRLHHTCSSLQIDDPYTQIETPLTTLPRWVSEARRTYDRLVRCQAYRFVAPLLPQQRGGAVRRLVWSQRSR